MGNVGSKEAVVPSPYKKQKLGRYLQFEWHFPLHAPLLAVRLLLLYSKLLWLHVSLGPIPMFIASELFRQGPRPKAMAVAGITLWIATLCIGMGFEPLQVIRPDSSSVPLYNRPTHLLTGQPVCVVSPGNAVDSDSAVRLYF